MSKKYRSPHYPRNVQRDLRFNLKNWFVIFKALKSQTIWCWKRVTWSCANFWISENHGDNRKQKFTRTVELHRKGLDLWSHVITSTLITINTFEWEHYVLISNAIKQFLMISQVESPYPSDWVKLAFWRLRPLNIENQNHRILNSPENPSSWANKPLKASTDISLAKLWFLFRMMALLWSTTKYNIYFFGKQSVGKPRNSNFNYNLCE